MTQMKRILIMLGFLAGISGYAQSASDPNEGLSISYDPGNQATPYSMTWWGRTGYYYFIIQKDSLGEQGTYFPYAVEGSNAAEGLALDSSAEMLFFNLHFTNDENSELFTSDFDGDGVSNGHELQQGTNPFAWVDTDEDGLPDDWEMFWFGNLDEEETQIKENHFTNNLEKFQMGLDPTINESTVMLVYEYDPLGRLIGVTGNQNAISYTIDDEGNITLISTN